MKAAIYLGQGNVEIRELPDPVCGDNDVVIKNIYSSICGTDVAVGKEVTDLKWVSGFSRIRSMLKTIQNVPEP